MWEALPERRIATFEAPSARIVTYQGPFGQLTGSDVFIPVAPLLALLLLAPPVVGLLTSLTVRSAPVTPPRRAT